MRTVTIFINGNYCTFDFTESVEPNLQVWLKGLIDKSDEIGTWKSTKNEEGNKMGDFLLVLKGRSVDGFYIRDTPDRPQETLLKKLSEEFTKPAGDEWKTS